jgi:hypothetical protein
MAFGLPSRVLVEPMIKVRDRFWGIAAEPVNFLVWSDEMRASFSVTPGIGFCVSHTRPSANWRSAPVVVQPFKREIL